jgi:hypothetical protein
MQTIGAILRTLSRRVAKRRRPCFLEPAPTTGFCMVDLNLPPIDPSDKLTLRRVEAAHAAGFNEGFKQAYRGVNLTWRNRWWWQRLHSPDLREDISRFEWVFWPLVNGWHGWRARRKYAAINRSRQFARS